MLLPLLLLTLAQDSASEPDPAEPTPLAPPSTCRAARSWPLADSSARLAAERPEAIAALEAMAFPAVDARAERDREGIRTDGLLILSRGELVYERYAHGYTAETPHLAWSATKTFTNALVGIAVRAGALSLDDSICEAVEAANPENCAVRVRDLLEFSSGIDWRETYEGDPPTTSSVIAMLYGQGREDMAGFVAGLPRRTEPGELWQYSSGDTTLLAGVVQAAMEPEHGRDFPWTMLFEPLGMEHVVWERDNAGTLVGSSYLFAPPRDLGRFGTLLLDDGCWDGERLLPEGWVAASTEPAPALRLRSMDRDPGDVNGRQMWLNQPLPEYGEAEPPWPSAPEDTYAAMGHWAQGVIVIPSLELVIVRTGDDRDGSFSWDELLRLVIAAVSTPVEASPARTNAPPSAVSETSTSRDYEVGLFPIGSAYGAKMACSCAFVMGRDEDACATWIRASPDIVTVRYDRDQKRVTARALGFTPARAAWVSERDGCVLE